MHTLSITQLNRYVKAVLEEDSKLADLFLKAEVSNFTRNGRSGHCYFSLKDENSSVRAVMWAGVASALKFLPEDGMSVIARVTVGLYERDGSFQVYVNDLIPEGEGALAAAMRQRVERLSKLGVFDPARKKPIPAWPMRVGVVTSETGAAIGDITQVLSRRWPVARMLFCPAQVQGEGAAQSLIAALKKLDGGGKCDVIIIGRGGGSSEDLRAFSDEALAMAVYEAKTPVISAVGHEMDISICDMAADLRAPTPSAAAELAVPLLEQELLSLERREKDLQRFIKNKWERLDFFADSLYNIQKEMIRGKNRELAAKSALLDSLSPLRILGRGYAAVFHEDRAVRSAAELREGQKVGIRFADGTAQARIEKAGVSADEG
ncbi:MAG: exodeoxyribonuclease VII large subunit [Oscillospiraceae bacterium]|nr:exodeoxyribonuclease VII large subunit [Oscillospiraceae bacterium]